MAELARAQRARAQMFKEDMKGLTSMGLAILLAIIVVVAAAIQWYMRTTYSSSATDVARVQIVSAQYSLSKGTLTLQVRNLGPANNARIARITLADQTCTVGTNLTIPMSSSPVNITVSCPGISATVGSILLGTLTPTSGPSQLFGATVVP